MKYLISSFGCLLYVTLDRVANINITKNLMSVEFYYTI